jgi:hypothetical protein
MAKKFVKLCDEGRERNTESETESADFYNVKASLSPLTLAHERLRFAYSLGKLRLS